MAGTGDGDLGEAVRIVLVSGSTRTGSTNTAALRTAAGMQVPGVMPVTWTGLAAVNIQSC